MSFASSKDAQAARWYSRRHETRESHDAAVKDHPYTGGRKARQQRAKERG